MTEYIFGCNCDLLREYFCETFRLDRSQFACTPVTEREGYYTSVRRRVTLRNLQPQNIKWFQNYLSRTQILSSFGSIWTKASGRFLLTDLTFSSWRFSYFMVIQAYRSLWSYSGTNNYLLSLPKLNQKYIFFVLINKVFLVCRNALTNLLVRNRQILHCTSVIFN